MSEGRFVIIVLDSFGVGAMDDVPQVRSQDIGANTAGHLLTFDAYKNWPTLTSLGLINTLRGITVNIPKSENAIFGTSDLKHYGADSYFGHQEIAGTNPKKPVFTKVQIHLDDIESDLQDEGFHVERVYKDGLALLKVDNVICIGDNMETDLGQAINVVGAMDYCGFEKIAFVGNLVRKHVKVARVIAFGGSKVTIERILNNIITKDGFIGIDAPGSGVYDDNYHVVHIGYGVDTSKQVPVALAKLGIQNHFYGKVADIIHNPLGTNYSCVDTDETFDHLIDGLNQYSDGFFFVNIQETDLAGHAENSERYIERLNVADKRLAQMMTLLNDEDILIVMADHGNDPTIGHSRHTRECVPLLIHYGNNQALKYVGHRKTMADVGQTVADYFGTSIEFGESFLKKIMD